MTPSILVVTAPTWPWKRAVRKPRPHTGRQAVRESHHPAVAMAAAGTKTTRPHQPVHPPVTVEAAVAVLLKTAANEDEEDNSKMETQ